MRKAMFFLLVAVFAFTGYSIQTTIAQESQQKPATENQGRWHGLIVRWDKEHSALDVQKGNAVRKVYYDSSTQWTEGKKTIDMSQFKEGSDVICLGKYDAKSGLHATRIDLQPR